MPWIDRRFARNEIPRQSARFPLDVRRFFSKDTANLRNLVKGAWRTMSAVFKQAGVRAAHPHRFRHTLASELLGKSGTLGEVAAILGDSAVTISRYYTKWTRNIKTGKMS